jgi:hypothetical protein
MLKARRMLIPSAVLALLVSSLGWAGGVDSLSAPPALAAAGDTAAVSSRHVTVELEDDSTLPASLVAWQSDGYILVVEPNGADALIGTHKVRRILDETGHDRTHFVIGKRGAVGTAPPSFPGHIDPAQFEEKKGTSLFKTLALGVLIGGAIVAGAVLLSTTGD